MLTRTTRPVMKPMQPLPLLIVRILGGKLMCASFKSIMQTTELIVKPRRELRVLPRQTLTLKRTKKPRNSDQNPATPSKKLLQRHKSGQRTTKRLMKSLTSSSQRNTTSETSTALTSPIHYEIKGPVVHATPSLSLK